MSPRTSPGNARLLVCGYFDGVEQCQRDTAGGYFTSVGTDSEALGRAALRVDPAESSDFEGVWLPLHASSRLVASRQPHASIQLTAL